MDAASTFMESVVQERCRSERRQPWFMSLPVRRILPVFYNGIINADNVQPYQLLSFGNTFLRFLIQLKETADDGAEDVDFVRYLSSFETLFHRILILHGDITGDDVQGFLDFVWNTHVNGPISFSGTKIPEKLAQACPQRIEQELESCLGNYTEFLQGKSPTPLVSLCEKNPTNLWRVLVFLCQTYTKTFSKESKLHIFNFSMSFLRLLEKSVEDELYLLFPSPLQPIIVFGSQVRVIRHSSQLLETEFMVLLDHAYHQSRIMKFNTLTVTFVLALFPEISHLIRDKLLLGSRSGNKRSTLYRCYPWIQRAMRKHSVLYFVQGLKV